MTINRFAVILTHNRPELLKQAVASVVDQVDQVIVVDNASDPPVVDGWEDSRILVRYVSDQPPNLARMWNSELDHIATMHGEDEAWDVALLCDDVLIPDGWVKLVSDEMRARGGDAGSTHSYQPSGTTYVLHDLTNGTDRMCPWAFMLRGEAGLRADESMRWWYCDTDLDWQARRAGGTVVVAGPVAPNQRIGEYTSLKPELGAQAAADGVTFGRKWGV